jgi:xylose isomerase
MPPLLAKQGNLFVLITLADKIMTSSSYEKLRTERYASFDSGKGKEFENGNLSMQDLYKIAQENGELTLKSGKQELFENIINQFI